MEAAIDLEAGKFASAERLLGVAETAAQNNGKTGLNSLVAQWFARLGRPEGFYRTILEQGSGVSDLPGSFSPDGALAPYVGELVAMADGAVAPLRQVSATGFVEQLSPREVTVLRYLPSRLTNQEIAAQLFVSVNTLKTHQKRIYRKLGASSRRHAVDIARASKLI